MPYSKVILSSHTFVPKSEIENINDLRHRFTVSSKYKNGPTIKYYKETEDYFGIPRHGVRLSKAMATTVVDNRTLGLPISVEFKGDLWDYQKKAIEEFKSLLTKGASGFFLESAPGSGKTVMGLKMLSILGTTALIVVPKSDLVLQWKNRILEFTNLEEIDIGLVEGGNSNYQGKKVVIGLIHSIVLKRIATSHFVKNFGLVIFDECDSSLPPKTFSSASGMFPSKYRIGMTASATRSDGLHVIFEDSLAQFRIKCNNTKTLTPSVVLHKFSGSSGIIPSYLKDIQRRGVLITNIASNPVRNDLISNYAFRSFNSGRITLVMSDRKDQLQTIRDTLVRVYKVDPKKIGFFVRSLSGKLLKQAEKDRSAEKASIILATYGMMSRGTDIPRLEALILATIRSDMRQTLGRIERFLVGKQAPVVIDIVDTFYKEAKNSAKSRIKFYQERNLKIKYIEESK
jgi:superfamily II DNA or RNA helicase